MQVLPVVVGKPYGAQDSIAARFNQPSDDGEDFRERSTGQDQSEKVKNGLTGGQSGCRLYVQCAWHER
jgi:hypothetical protein